jgi:hypothetical protein
VTGLVTALIEPGRHDLVGVYDGFRRCLPSLLPDEGIAFVPQWAAGNAGTGEPIGGPAAGAGARLSDT